MRDTRSYVCHVTAEAVAIPPWSDTRNLNCLRFLGVNLYFGGVQGGLVGQAKQLSMKLMKTCDVFCNIHTLDPNLRYPINYKFLQ